MRSLISYLSSLALYRTVYILSFIESLLRFSMSPDIDCYTECRINSFIIISKIGRERNELNQDSKTENESEGPFSPWLALVALTSSFCLLHSCWSLFTARFFPISKLPLFLSLLSPRVSDSATDHFSSILFLIPTGKHPTSSIKSIVGFNFPPMLLPNQGVEIPRWILRCLHLIDFHLKPWNWRESYPLLIPTIL